MDQILKHFVNLVSEHVFFCSLFWGSLGTWRLGENCIDPFYGSVQLSVKYILVKNGSAPFSVKKTALSLISCCFFKRVRVQIKIWLLW